MKICLVFALFCGLAVYAAELRKDDSTKGRIAISDSMKAHETAGAGHVGIDGVEEDPGKSGKSGKGKGTKVPKPSKPTNPKAPNPKAGGGDVSAGVEGVEEDPGKTGKAKVSKTTKPQAPKGQPQQKKQSQKGKGQKSGKTAAKTIVKAKATLKVKRITKIVRLLSKVIMYLERKYGIELDDIANFGEMMDLNDEALIDDHVGTGALEKGEDDDLPHDE